MYCERCDVELGRRDRYEVKDGICSKCRKNDRDDAKESVRIAEIEKEGYEVLQINREDINGVRWTCEVKCTDCGKERKSNYFNLVRAKRKCSCKHNEATRKLVESIQIAPVVCEVPTELTGVTGIYRIDVGPEFYIGSSVNVGNRLRSHVRSIRDKKHTLPMLQAVERYGITEEAFSLLEECEANELPVVEQKYIDELKPTINVLEDAINPMHDIKNKFATLCGENNSSSKYSNEKYKAVLLRLLDTKDLNKVAELEQVTFNVVAAISSGKSMKWLEEVYPVEYKKVGLTKGSRFGYNQIVAILTDISEDKMAQSTIAKKHGIDTTQVQKFKYMDRAFMKNMNNNDDTVAELYKIINGGV